MLNLNSIMIGTMQMKVMAEFYKQVFEKIEPMIDGEWYGWQVGACFISVGPHSEMKGKSKDPARVMFCLETKEVKEEFERIKAIDGVTVIKEPYTIEGYPDYWIATFADPDGNYFQLMTPWDVEK